MKVRFTPQQTASDVSRGVKVPYGPGRRKAAQWRWYLILAIVCSPFAYLLFTMFYPLVVVSAPGFIHLEKEVLTAASDGVVKVIHVRTGDRVRAGQPVVELTSPKLEERILAIKSAIAHSDQTDDKTRPAAPNRQADSLLTLYRQQVEDAARVVARQQQRVEVVRQLFVQGAATAAEVNAVAVQFEAARHTLVQAQLDFKAAELKNLALDVSQPEAMPSRQQLLDQLARLEQQQRSLVMMASQDGTVLDTPVEIGKNIAAGEVVALVSMPAPPQVLAYLDPRSVQTATPGRLATVSIPGGLSVEARVREQPSQARRLPADFGSAIGTRDIMVLVTLDFTAPLPPERAVEGLPVEVRFHRF